MLMVTQVTSTWYWTFQNSNQCLMMLRARMYNSGASILVYIAGYVAISVRKKTMCQTCNCRLSHQPNLETEISPVISEYLKLVDRGGLKWPTKFTGNLCTGAYLSFREILVNYEKDFLRGSHQRQILVNCNYAYNGGKFDVDETCSCTWSLGDLMKSCLSSIFVATTLFHTHRSQTTHQPVRSYQGHNWYQRSEITQNQRVDEIHVPDMETTRSGLYKCTKEYSQRVTVAVVVCLLLFREEKIVPILHFNTGILN